jgi:hypothetical protein
MTPTVKRLAPCVLLLLAACGGEKSPAPAGCPQNPAFDRTGFITVAGELPPAVLRRDRDLAWLAKRTADSGANRTQGLTEFEPQLNFRSRVHSVREHGWTCVWLEDVVIDLSPASVEIIIPSEYLDGSCEYDAILAHEREHERVYRERIATAVSEIRAALGAAKWIPARGNPVSAADQSSGEAALNAKLRKAVAPAYDKHKVELGVAQAELDQPALYQWVTKRCAGWK